MLIRRLRLFGTRWRAATRRQIVTASAVGAAVLALAVPAVWVSKARMATISALMPVLRAGAALEGGAERAGGGGGADREVLKLRAELIRLKDRLRRLEEELSRDGAFRERARMFGLDLGRFVEAFVVAHSVNWQERTFLVDRGREHGVVPRAGCIAGGAAAGIVVEVGPAASRVAMPSEPGVKIPVRTLNTRRTGVLLGTGEGCDLRYLERWPRRGERPRAGEPVVTTGRLGLFPPGFLVGWVTDVGEDPDSLYLNVAVALELDAPPEGRVWIVAAAPSDVGGVRRNEPWQPPE